VRFRWDGKGSAVKIRYFLLVTIAVIVIAPFIGRSWIPLREIVDSQADPGFTIFWKLRVMRVLTAFLAGAALSVCGMTFQAMFRNPLATPFTLGISSGASFGAALCMSLGLTFSLGGVSAISLFAFGGAMIAISIVYTLSRLKREFSSMTLLLAGVAVNFFFASVVLFLQYFATFVDSHLIIVWLMGGLSVTGPGPVLDALPFFITGAGIILYLRQELNLLYVGEETAVSRGVDADQVKKVLFFATSLTVGGIVAVTGPIGFVGMMVPHICRLLIGQDHCWLIPASCLFGGGFLILCDSVARLAIAPAEIPVGVITTLLGGPFFLWLLIRSRTHIS
jgi:iron complex transport system permease protein